MNAITQEVIDIDVFKNMIRRAILESLKDQQEQGESKPWIVSLGEGKRIYTRETRTGKCQDGGDYNYYMDVWQTDKGIYLQEDWSASFDYQNPTRFFCNQHKDIPLWVDQLAEEIYIGEKENEIEPVLSDGTEKQLAKIGDILSRVEKLLRELKSC